jgi:HD superfamily phosphohydrolase
MPDLLFIPELRELSARRNLIRIPHETDVPLTPRVRRLVDTSAFRRLARISQVGLVSLVYPAANHSRFEHSLGVYRNALLYLQQLATEERFAALIEPADAELLIAAALLHDLGHWPFCHPIEDIALPGVPTHEVFGRQFLLENNEVASAIKDDWGIEPSAVAALLADKPQVKKRKLLHSLLSGPIDIDKLDYLSRDSLHAGVPYGRHFDQQRIIGSLCLNEAGDGLALRDKGRTAAEMMVFARYVMFSEVYWHHAVRSATAMFQRAFFLLREKLDLDSLFRLAEGAFVNELEQAAAGTGAADLLDGLFGPRRRLYKRLAEFSYFQNGEWYENIARQPYANLAAFSERFAGAAARQLGRTIAPHEILFDAPPQHREVEFDVEIFFPKERVYRPLGEVSPVVHTLATKQFDDYVKRVRIFTRAELAGDLASLRLDDVLAESLQEMA